MSINSKHFLNTPETLVVDSLEGLANINPKLSLDKQNKILHIAKPDRSKVAIICGGGSGHEPAHAGFVGDGMLTAAVAGTVFASPNSSQVRRGIDIVDNDKGTLIIVKNYTGDVLNFGLAKEQYAALRPDKADKVKFITVGDDVAVTRSQGKIVGRRGLAGTVLVYKIAGALAQKGLSLDEIYNVSQYAANRVASIGVGLEHCHVPGTAPTTSHLQANEIEIGMGIHNESGVKRLSPAPALSELIPQLLDLLTSTSDPERSYVPFKGKDEVVLLVNNLGGVSELELGAVVAEARRQLDKRGLKALRVLSGTYMTSLNMPGFSITLLLLPTAGEKDAPSKDVILSALDAKADVPGWRWSSAAPAPEQVAFTPAAAAQTTKPTGSPIKAADPSGFVAGIKRACEALIAAEPKITEMDNIAGDGDCGLTLKAGAEGVLAKISSGAITGDNIVQSVIAIAQVAEEAMGGTSGALYSIFFSGLARGIQSSSGTATPEDWARALTFALKNLYTYTRARPPSRTLVDPLDAFVTPLSSSTDYATAVKSAAEAADKTKDLVAKAGRAAYVEGDRLKEEKIPDPGAWGVKTVLEALFN
ncbi:Dak1 domain-containing protein [Schizophyllum fasciatum]